MENFDYLIIGADAAGLSAAVQIRNNQKNATIGILEKGKIISYGACGLPYVISGDVADFKNLIHFSPEKFEKSYQVKIFTETEAIAVDFKQNSVQCKQNDIASSFSYGKLLIATGASPVRLPVLDYTSDKIHVLKTIADGSAILNQVHNPENTDITIIGAGYIGLELAEALHKQGKQVRILDLAQRPADRMPEKISKHILSQMEEFGISFLPQTQIQKIQIHPGSIEIFTQDQTIHTNLIVSATGIRPATEFLKDSTLEMQKGAIVIDRSGKTNIDNVYAAGDCAMVYHILKNQNVYFPLGSTANKQGRIAGLSISGEQTQFPGIVGSRIFKFFDKAYAATGLSEDEARELGFDPVSATAIRNNTAGYYPGGEKTEVTLVINKTDGVILGGYLSGPLASSGMIDTIAVMAQKRMTADEASWLDAAYAPPFAPVWNAYTSAAGKFRIKTNKD